MSFIRQGDVMLIPANLPDGEIITVSREDGRLILAKGEATGHAHAIFQADAELVEANGQRYLRVSAPVTLAHQEHAPHTVAEGVYRVVIQREYAPAAIRQVRD